MAYIQRDGAAIYYEAHGSGPAILLTHGYAATTRMWAPQLDLLTPDRQVILWDMRGHGQSDSPDDPALYSEAATVADMAAILDAVGAEKAIIGGHSLGGYMSMAFHLRHPARVSALLLCGAGPGYRKDESREAWNVIAVGLGDDIERGGLEQLDRHSVEMAPRDHRSAAGLAKAARGMLTQRDGRVIASLGSIAVPTLVTVGGEDESYLAGTQYLAAKIADADYAVFEGAGHAANVDRPAEFNAVLARFLRERVTPRGA